MPLQVTFANQFHTSLLFDFADSVKLLKHCCYHIVHVLCGIEAAQTERSAGVEVVSQSIAPHEHGKNSESGACVPVVQASTAQASGAPADFTPKAQAAPLRIQYGGGGCSGLRAPPFCVKPAEQPKPGGGR